MHVLVVDFTDAYVIPVLTFGTLGHVPSEESLAPRVYLRQPQNHCQHSQGATK